MRGALVVAAKHLRKFFRSPLELISSLAAPLLWLVLFGVILDAALAEGMLGAAAAREGGYLAFLAPGIVALTAWSAALFGGTTFYLEKDRGLILQYLAAPIRRLDYFLGLAGSAAAKTALQVALILAIAMLLGVRPSPAGALLAILVAAVFALGVYGLSVWMAAGARSFEAYHGVILLLQVPLFFVSDALYPLAAMPPPLRWIATVNPLTHLVETLRYLLAGTASPLGIEVNAAVLLLVVVAGSLLGARSVARWEPA